MSDSKKAETIAILTLGAKILDIIGETEAADMTRQAILTAKAEPTTDMR